MKLWILVRKMSEYDGEMDRLRARDDYEREKQRKKRKKQNEKGE